MLQRQDAKSLALFRAIQAKLSSSDISDRSAYLAEAKQWAEESYQEQPNCVYLLEWADRIADALSSEGGLAGLYEFMLSPEQHAIDMRSSSPFPGVLTTKERTEALLAFQREWVG